VKVYDLKQCKVQKKYEIPNLEDQDFKINSISISEKKGYLSVITNTGYGYVMNLKSEVNEYYLRFKIPKVKLTGSFIDEGTILIAFYNGFIMKLKFNDNQCKKKIYQFLKKKEKKTEIELKSSFSLFNIYNIILIPFFCILFFYLIKIFNF
jgi:hypothetical protein